MKFNGTVLRLSLFTLLIAAVITYVTREVLDNKDIGVFLCDTDTVMRECYGLDDYDTCVDLGGGGIMCVRSACGHQIAQGVDVSVSGAADPLMEEGNPTDVIAILMIVWSMIPYALLIVLLGCFLVSGDTTTLSVILLFGVIAVVNEGMLKSVIGTHRPDGSCLYFKSVGMPSGPAAISTGVMWDLLLEIWIDRPESSLGQKSFLSTVLVAFLGSVPYSGIYLHDYFLIQVGVGSVAGLFIATLWFLFMYVFARTRLDGWVSAFCCKVLHLRNTYRNDKRWLPTRREVESGLYEEETVVINNLSTDDEAKHNYKEMK